MVKKTNRRIKVELDERSIQKNRRKIARYE